MAGRGAGFSRRQFLVVAGGGAVLAWSGRPTWRQAPSGADVTPGAAAVVAGPGVRRPPFTDTFADPALPAWNVRRPVAILGTTAFGLALPANQGLDRPEVLRDRGTVLGLDGRLGGSTAPGLIESVEAFAFEAGAAYTLAFTVAGSQVRTDRMPPSTVRASLPGLGLSRQVTRRPDDDFLEFSLEVPGGGPAVSTIVLASETTPGQAGVLLEQVSLTRTG